MMSSTLFPRVHHRPMLNVIQQFFIIIFISSGGWRKITFSSPHFHVFSYTSCVNLTQLHVRNPALAGVSFSSGGSDSASCPYRRSPFLKQRKLPLHRDASLYRPDLIVAGDNIS